MIRRLLLAIAVLGGALLFLPAPAHALSSDGKQFVSGDNTFYAYVNAGEKISSSFLRVDQSESLDTVRGDVTITMDGPGVQQQKCIAGANTAFGTGCTFAAITAPKSGIWRIQFALPPDAATFEEVAPSVKWGKNLFSWDVTVTGIDGEQHGRVWTEQYAVRQPSTAAYLDNMVYYYISEDGYIYRATSKGYNGEISTLSADGIGIRSGTKCTSVYKSTEVSDPKYSPALGSCGNAYKLFFEQPAGDLPAKATAWDGSTDWVRPGISRPMISDLKFTSDNSADQQSGNITFKLHNFIGQYQVKVDTDGDGSFDGQDDVTLNEQIKKLTDDTQTVHFDGTTKSGQIVSTSGQIGVKIDITKVAEIHLVAADVEGRTGGIELVRLNGDNAPNSHVCWNDTDLAPIANASLTTSVLDGTDCPDSTGGLHAWGFDDNSWGNARFIDDWTYASAKMEGTNQITYPDAAAAQLVTVKNNWALIVTVAVLSLLAVAALIFLVLRSRKKPLAVVAPSQTPGIMHYDEDTPENDRTPPPPSV